MRLAPSTHRVVSLVAWLAITFAAAAMGAAASVRSAEFYAALAQPAWAPPSAVFGPVWSVLYALMAIAAWLVWERSKSVGVRGPITLFMVQLVANALWSWLFFAWRLGGAAFAEIVLLGVLIVATAVSFWRVRALAGALLVPYLLWVTFAAFLNYSVWQLNPQVLGS